ncbi:MAG: epoxyqueuosine reductase [Planctomycetes bacterium]|nr:epoxyqueuosine reductase [Planctomycetota bacterium]
MADISVQLREYLVSRGASLAGYADMHEVPAEARSSLPRAVSIAVALNPGIIGGISAGPTTEYFAEYGRANTLLKELAQAAQEFLASRGHRAIGGSPTLPQLPEDLTTPLPNKTAATRAGLGWIGKSGLMITPQHGPAVRLVTVLTDAPVACGRPMNKSRCGACIECTTHCPAKAIKGVTWKPGMRREEFYDAFACKANAQAMSAAIGLKATVCGICINVCPWTRKYLAKTIATR